MKAYSVKLTTYEDDKKKIVFLPCSSLLEANKEKAYWSKSKYRVEIICEEDENSCKLSA